MHNRKNTKLARECRHAFRDVFKDAVDVTLIDEVQARLDGLPPRVLQALADDNIAMVSNMAAAKLGEMTLH